MKLKNEAPGAIEKTLIHALVWMLKKCPSIVEVDLITVAQVESFEEYMHAKMAEFRREYNVH